MNPEKHGIYMGLKNMSVFREVFHKVHPQCDIKHFKNLLFESSFSNENKIIKTKSTFLRIKYRVATILIRIELLELELEFNCLELNI